MNKKIYMALAMGVAFCARAEQLRFSEAPKAVQKTINQNLNGGSVQEIDRKARDGRTVYEVEIRREGSNQHLRVDSDGNLLSRNGNDEKSIEIEANADKPEMKDRDLNAEIKVQADADDRELNVETKRKKSVFSKTDGKLFGIIPWRGKAKDHADTDRNTVTRKADGSLDTDKGDGRVLGVPKRGFETLSIRDVPQPVRTTLEKLAPGAKIAEIELADENGEKVYEIDIERDGKNRELRIARDGTLLKDTELEAVGSPGRTVRDSESQKIHR